MQKVQCMGIRPLGAHLGTHLVQMPTAGQGPLHGWPSENGVTLLHPQSMCASPSPLRCPGWDASLPRHPMGTSLTASCDASAHSAA